MCTPMRNHSSGEGTFLLYFTNVDIFKYLFLSRYMSVRTTETPGMTEREISSGRRGERHAAVQA